MNAAFTIGLDIGGTQIKSVILDPQGSLLHQQLFQTKDHLPGEWLQSVHGAVKELRKSIADQVYRIGIAAPGLPNAENTAIAVMPGRLLGLEGLIWEEAFSTPTYVLNDAIAALYAEAHFGAAKGHKNAVMLTLGTGVGGAILIDGKPYQGAFGKAGHIGHMVIDSDGPPDVTGIPGSLEDAIGNATVGLRSNGTFNSTRALVEAHVDGDAFATEVWLCSVRKLAIGIASITNILSPEVVILGGGITQAGAVLMDPLKKYMEQYEWRAGGNQVALKFATMNEMSGAIGAAYYSMKK
ncbi:MAG: ROK family protein [Chitinophagaceae bacterium]|nr:ROK family protein [Chitinophagaceae bacterium]